MKRCLALARAARARHYPAVGSLIVLDGVVLAEGEEGDGSLPVPLAHAEAVAVVKALGQVAAGQLSRATLYTTVEPCLMCAYLIRKAGIGTVVYGTETAGAGGVSSPYPILTAPDISRWGIPPRVVRGILEEQCRELMNGQVPRREPKAP
jgi:tRNA(adenine34) deaminase